MTVRRLAVLITMLPSVAAAQEPITFADLRGKVIEANITLQQDIRRGGRALSVETLSIWKVAVGRDDGIHMSLTRVISTPRGKRRTPPLRGSFVLGETRPVPSMGGGQGGWIFSDQTLAFVRTFRSGAFRLTLTLARNAGGLGCTATSLFAREDGAGPIVLEPGAPGVQVTLLRSRPLRATCAVGEDTGTR